MTRSILTRFLCLLLALSAINGALGCDNKVEGVFDSTAVEEEIEEKEDCEKPLQEPLFSLNPSDYSPPKKNYEELTLVCVSYNSLGKTNFLTAFENSGEYYMVLPPSVPMQGVALYFGVPNEGTVMVNGEDLSGKTAIYDFSVDNVLEFSYKKGIEPQKVTSLTVWSSTVPTIYLDVDETIQSVERMHADSHQAKVTHCYGTCYVDSEDNSYDLISYFDIHGHGNSTWWRHDKKPYNLRLTENSDYDNSRKVNLLGMRNSAKWVLLADVWDETQTKTAIAHYMGAQVGVNYAIQLRYVNLYIKDEYRGLYVLTEKPSEVDRILDLDLATGDNLDGSWIVEFDNRDGDNQIVADGTVITIKSTLENCRYNAIKQFVKEAQIALKDPKGINKTTEKYFYDYIDLESYAKYLLVREFTMDNDTVTNNWAYYNAKDGKMYAGPLWDFDNSMGNNSRELFNDTSALLVKQDTKNPDGWLVLLMNHPEFIKVLKEQYQKYAYLFDVNDARSVYAYHESLYAEMSELMYYSDLKWGYVSKTRELSGFEFDNSAYAREYSYLARFLYNRCQNYGYLIKGL